MGKNEIRTIASIVVTLALFLSLITPAAAAGGRHWAAETLAAWEQNGWLQGDGNGNLRPDDPVTRAEFVALINRSFGLGQVPGAASFADLPESDWAYADVQTAVAEGYLQGGGDGKVRPHEAITREEAAVILARLLGLEIRDAEVAYKDRDQIAGWSLGAVAAASRAGIFQGLPDGTFRPKATMTRAEAAVSLGRAQHAGGLGTIYPKAGTFGPGDGVETIEGNVTVMAAGVTLRNLHIKGDLIIAASVGEGDVYLNGVTVDGNAIVRGGGENSVHVTDSVLVTVVVDKKTGTVRLVAQGRTVIREVEVRSPSIVHASGLSDGGGISSVKLSEQLPENSRVELRGSIDKVNVAAKLIHIAVPEGSIGEIQVDEGADDVDIELSQEAAVVELILNAVAKVIGEGEVGKAVVNAEGVSFDKAPKEVEVGANVPEDAEVVIGGEAKKAGEVQNSTQPSQSAPSSNPSQGSPSNPSQGGGQQSAYTMYISPSLNGGEDRVIQVNSFFLILFKDNNPVPISLPEQIGGKWYTEFEGETYQISVYGGNEAIPLENVQYWDKDGNYVTFSANYSFSGRQTFRAVLTPSGAGAQAIEAQGEYPDRPVIVRAIDEDSNIGLDGRDFTVTWLPSGRSGVSSTKLYIIPVPPGSFSFDHTAWTPVAELDAVESPHTWRGTEDLKDSAGNPFKARQNYYIYIAEFVGGKAYPDSNSTYYQPVVELMMDYTDPGPNQSILPSDDDPVPVVYVTSDKSLDLNAADRGFATVGDIVYGQSNLDGYFYLLPVNYGYSKPTIAFLEAAVQGGEGIRVPANAGEWVMLDTRWMEIGEYVLLGVSEKNQISGYTTASSIRLFAEASKPLENLYARASGSGDYTVVFEFNKEIFSALASLDDLASALKIRDEDTGQVNSLSRDNLSGIDRWKLTLNLPDWFDRGMFTLIIPAGTVKDRFGKVNDTDIETYPAIFRPILTVESEDRLDNVKYRKDGTLTITASKKVPHLYLALKTENIFGTHYYDIAVEQGRAKKLSLIGGVPAELSLKGLAPGEYQLVSVNTRGNDYYYYDYFDEIQIVEQ